MHRPRGSTPAALAAALVLLLPSCFTVALWGGTIEDSDGDGADEVELDPTAADVGEFLLKVLITPVTVVLDICTSPVQAWLYGWEDEEDDC